MADKSTAKKQDSPVSPVHSHEGVPESPTTAQPLDFDDDDNLTTQTPTKMSDTENKQSKPSPPPKDEAPPAKPPRPMDPREQALQTLQEAFPTIDKGVIKAILTASGGQIEPAFAALLEMSDPEAAQKEPPPPAMPPRPTSRSNQPATAQSQLEADELYARQLADHFNSTGTAPAQIPRGDRLNSNLPGSRPAQGRPGSNPNPDDPEYHWRSFIDGASEFRSELRDSANEILTDDLPEIRDNIRKGFLETQKTVNSWISNFKKNFDDGADETSDYTAQNSGRQGGAQGMGQAQRRSGEIRRSADYNRYDADPQVIGDDFSKLDLKDGDHPPRTSSRTSGRPTANPNLFKSDRRESSKSSGRKVSFQEGPPEEIMDMYSSSTPKPAATTTTTPTSVQTGAAASGGKSSKWQPLSAVEPSPVGENDPFSLGDSDDEKDAKPITLMDEEGEVKGKEKGLGKEGKGEDVAATKEGEGLEANKATVEDSK